MEVAPEFWQSPEILQQIHVSTIGGAVGGTQGTQPLAGTVMGKPRSAKSGTGGEAPIASNAARNAANGSGIQQLQPRGATY
jgi:multidrug efflux pump